MSKTISDKITVFLVRRDGESENEEWDSGCEGDSAISSAIAAYMVGR